MAAIISNEPPSTGAARGCPLLSNLRGPEDPEPDIKGPCPHPNSVARQSEPAAAAGKPDRPLAAGKRVETGHDCSARVY